MGNYLKNVLILFVFILTSSCAKNDNSNENEEIIIPVEPHSLGLQVDLDGVVKLNGNQFKGVGVNYFSAFYRNLTDGTDTTYNAGFRYLKSQHIPFVRFMAGGYWASEWNLYLTNKPEYFAKLDKVVHSAEKIGIGLIPSLFWSYHTIPDIVKEPVNQWGNINSKTIAFMKQYIVEVVTRYKTSPAILGWEFGNEYNLAVDLPGLDNLPPTLVSLGCPSTRSAADKLSTRDLIVALEEFGKMVRKLDVSRIIFSGNAIPREAAYNLDSKKTWDLDNSSQYELVLGSQNPDPLNSITIHLYPSTTNRFSDSPTTSLKEIIRISMEDARKKKKPLFIGEFGAAIGAEENLKFKELLDGIETYNVPISAVWVFDLPQQNTDWNITSSNSRKFMLEEIGNLNVRFGNK